MELKTAESIQSGQEMRLLKSIERSLPSHGVALLENFPHRHGLGYWLWRIIRHCETYNKELEKEDVELLQSLPKDDPGEEFQFRGF